MAARSTTVQFKQFLAGPCYIVLTEDCMPCIFSTGYAWSCERVPVGTLSKVGMQQEQTKEYGGGKIQLLPLLISNSF